MCPPLRLEPLTVGELGQLFADFNFRVYPVPARVNMALDQSDIYIALANKLARRSFIADFGGMEVKAASLGKKSMSIVVQTVLVRTVRGAAEGRDFQENNLANPKGAHLTDETFLVELESVADFFTAIQQRMGGRWSNRESLHLSSPGWQALGVIHHDMNHRASPSPNRKSSAFTIKSPPLTGRGLIENGLTTQNSAFGERRRAARWSR